MLDLRTLLGTPYVDPYNGIDISPDGEQVAFSWNVSGQWEIYTISLSGKGKARRISGGSGGKSSPRFSPDGSRLAYVIDIDGSERLHLIIHQIQSGISRDLTADSSGSLQPNFAWSPDGMEIAFLSNINGNFDVYILPAAGEAHAGTSPRRILSIIRTACDIKWSPDGSLLAVVFEGEGQDFFTYLVSPTSLESWPLTEDGKQMDARNPSWAPDSRHLAFTSNSHGWQCLGIYDITERRIFWQMRTGEELTSPDWSPDGRKVASVVAKGARTWIEIWEQGKESVCHYVEPGTHYTPAFLPDGKSIVFVFESPHGSNDLWKWSFDEDSLTRLTFSLPAGSFSQDSFLPQEITYPGMDGSPVPALLYCTPQTGPGNPAVVVIHGGPDWHFSYFFYPFMIHLADRGWTVLAPNYRGSTGYGREWQTANRYRMGMIDTDDCAAGARYLVQSGLADPKRIAVTGRSHGGFLTMSCLTRYPEYWAGGSAVVPFLNWFTSYEHSRIDLKQWTIENMGSPGENHELWQTSSPYFYLDRVQAPVQLICCANDPRCPTIDSIEARDRLLELGCPVDFILYEDEGHGFLRIENLIDSEVRRVEFLAKLL